MQFKTLFKQPFTWMIVAFCFIFLSLFIFTCFNDKFYNMPIGKITNVTPIHSEKITDEQHNKDIKYKEKLTLKILNGKFEGQSATINHQYVKSQADSEAFSKNDKVLLHISKKRTTLTLLRKKRDGLVVAITGLFLLIVLIVGKRSVYNLYCHLLLIPLLSSGQYIYIINMAK